MAFKFYMESSILVRDVSSLSVREVSVVSGLSSFASFLNDLNLGGNGGTCGGSFWYFWRPKVFLSWSGIGSFIDGYVASDLLFLLFLGMRLPGVTIALVSPVSLELTDRSVQSLSTTITSVAGAFDWVIQFGPLFTFFSL